MFWNNIAFLYDINEMLLTNKVNKMLCAKMSSYMDKEDEVLECACGTGMITSAIAQLCKSIVATDIAENMLKIAKKKCHKYKNITWQLADITNLPYDDDIFDKAIASNVIHLLDEPYKAIDEMIRVTKDSGTIIIPTYITGNLKWFNDMTVNVWNRFGANFRKQFTYDEYKKFFEDGDYKAEFEIIEGRIPIAIAVINKLELIKMRSWNTINEIIDHESD